MIAVVGLVGNALISRALAPAERGHFYVIISLVAAALAFGHLSIEQAQVYLWTLGRKRANIIANAMALGIFVGSGAAVAGALLTLVDQGRLVPISDPRALDVALLGVPLAMATLYLSGTALLDDRAGWVNAAALLAGLVELAGLGVLMLTHRATVFMVVVIWTASGVTPLFVFVPLFRVAIGQVSVALAKEALRFGVRYHAAMVSVFLLFRVDVLLLNRLAPAEQVGLYSVAVLLAEASYLVTNSIAQVMLPSQVSATSDLAAQITARVARACFIGACTVGLAAIVLGPAMLPLIFGSPYRGSYGPLVALEPGMIALALIRPLGAYLLRANRPWIISLVSIAAMVINVACNLLLIPRYGALGASISSSIAYAALTSAYIIWFARSQERSVWRTIAMLVRPA